MEAVYDIFRATSDGACAVDRYQRIVFWNRAAECLLGYDACEVLGHHCHEVFCGRDEQDRCVCRRGCPLFVSARNGRSVPTETLRARHRDGDALWLSVSTIVLPARTDLDAVLVHLFRNVDHAKTCETAVARLLEDLNSTIPSAPSAAASTAVECLTRREHEVLGLLATGRSTAEIADGLVISLSTVRNHVSGILAKLKAHSRLEAVAIALRDGLL